MRRNRAIFIAVVLAFSSMCRKFIFLISFALVLSLVNRVGADMLPTPWDSQDIGTNHGGVTGSADYDMGPPETVTIIADGEDIWSPGGDDFHYVYRPWSGDCEVIARVVSFTGGTNAWRKCGVMIREQLTDTSPHAMMIITAGGGDGASFQYVDGTNRDNNDDSASLVGPPYWVRLVREGQTFTGYTSPDGSDWTQVSTHTFATPMSNDYYVGLCLTSHQTGTLTTAVVDNFGGDISFYSPYARDPDPYNGEPGVPVDANVTWTRGDGADEDRVYFGTDPCDVNLPHVDTIEAVLPPLYDPPGDLIASTTYYWYITEVNDVNEYPGPVWSFSTISGQAHTPSPPHESVIDGSEYAGYIYAELCFALGPTATKHTGFFSESYNDILNRVEDANMGHSPYSGGSGRLCYRVGMPPYLPNASLERGKTYYWCIDEEDSLGNKFEGEIWQFTIKGFKAFLPNPSHGAIFVDPNVTLSWEAGFGVEKHDVYLGTSWGDVNDAVYDANTPPPEFLTTTLDPNYQCSGLPYETKHYWRVDEVIGRLPPSVGTIYKGDVWEFTTKILTSGHRERGYLYLSPVPGAEYVSPQTKFFLVRFEAVSPNDITNLPTFIEVTGETSGTHTGQTRIASDDRTVIFDVSSNFSSDELVTVTLTPTVDPCAPAVVEPYQYQFMVSGPMPASPSQASASTLLQAPSSRTAAREQVMNSQARPETGCEALPTADMAITAEDGISVTALDGPMIMPNGVSVPSNFPLIDITINDNPDPGYIFLDNRTSGSNSYNVIFDNNGSPIWYWQTGDERRDMKVQHNGMLTMLARSPNRFIGLDTHYREVASYRAVNGYSTDEHELQVLEDGGYLLIGLRTEYVDMTQYLSGANPNASVRETIIQEFTAAGELIFQWRAWDNFDVRDVHLDNPYGGSFRFPHMNAIDIDEDGHILLSSRHISEVTKINRDTGEIIWRLSGANSDFTFVNDPLNGVSCQHAIRHTGNGRYLLFDNGNLHSPSVSRAVEYELDLDAMTATVVWEFRETPDVYSHYMANTQRLPNGNTLINWAIGSLPKLTEVRPDGTKAFEMNWVDRYEAYRVWRCPWQGMALKPNLIVESPPDYITLIFNKFGDPNVAYYRIYGGTTPQPTTVIATSTSTLKRISEGLENGIQYYFRVTAVDINDTESDYSNEESAVVSFTEPGQNMVLNGDFCQGQDSWIWEVGSAASAVWNIEDGVSHFDIANGGIQISDVQLRQAGIRLVRGKKYVFEFDAWSATQPRLIEAKVGQDESPWTNYSNIGYSSITPNLTHFRYPFTMQDSSDYNARVVFNTGTSDFDVYLDNVSLITVLPGDFDFDGCVKFDDLAVLTDEWLEEQSGLTADLDDNDRIDFNDFAIFADSFKYPCSTTLVTEKDAKRVLVPTSNIGYDWIGNAEPYDDTGWDQIAASDCPTGIGYENNPGSSTSYTDLIGHDVGAEMFGIMNSCYVRIPFVLNIAPNELSSITLKIRYDDGFVAYINGQELTRDNFDAPIPDWNDDADGLHDDDEARLLQPFRVNRVDKPDVFNALQLGDNILAIHGMNDHTGSSDFLISAELSVQ